MVLGVRIWGGVGIAERVSVLRGGESSHSHGGSGCGSGGETCGETGSSGSGSDSAGKDDSPTNDLDPCEEGGQVHTPNPHQH